MIGHSREQWFAVLILILGALLGADGSEDATVAPAMLGSASDIGCHRRHADAE